MSQSDLHRNLVLRVAEEIKSRYPQIAVVVDVQKIPGDPVPPLIGGFRPDVYAETQTACAIVVIAEAKTDNDINNRHTREQVSAFIRHLEEKPNGRFIFSVTDVGANRAKTVLRFMHQEMRTVGTELSVFDQLDLWSLDLESGVLWHLI